jgi:ribose transport system substrate-binding protein
MGARKAFQELPNEMDRDRWLKLPFIGCDGLPNTGQAWVRSGQLAATVFVPPNTGQAIEMIVDAIQNRKQPPSKVLVAPRSIPALNAIQARRPG